MEMRQVAPRRANSAVPPLAVAVLGLMLALPAQGLTPVPVPPVTVPSVTVGNLGGYAACIVDDLAIKDSYSMAESLDPIQALKVTGTGSCSKDPSDAGTFVPVTFQFQDFGMIVRGIPSAPACIGDPGLGSKVIPGQFSINDGSFGATADATLAITSQYLDPTARAIGVSIDIPGVKMVSSLAVTSVYPTLKANDPLWTWTHIAAVDQVYAPVPNASSTPIPLSACAREVHVTGSLDTMQSPELTGGLPVSTDAIDGTAVGKVESMAASAIQGTPIANVDLGGVGSAIDTESAQALSSVIDTLAAVFEGAPIPMTADPSLLADKLPYRVDVKYRTVMGDTSTISAVGVPGQKVVMLVPNANNFGIPEIVYVSILLTPNNAGNTSFVVHVERAATLIACQQLPIDVLLVTPVVAPASPVPAVSPLSVQVGFEGLSAGGASPETFDLAYSSTSSSSGRSNSMGLSMKPSCGTTVPLTVVSKYQLSTDHTDLSLRIPLSKNSGRLELFSTRASGVNEVAYSATQVASMFLAGSDAGQPLSVSLQNLGTQLTLCSGKRDVCARPWRLHRPMDNGATFTSLNGPAYQPVTVNLVTHNLSYNASGQVTSDAVTTVTNLTLSDFSYDSRTADYPKHIYLDTRYQPFGGRVAYDVGGKHLSVAGSFRAFNREIEVKKNTFGYRLSRNGTMSCNAFNIDAGLPGLVENLLEGYLCR